MRDREARGAVSMFACMRGKVGGWEGGFNGSERLSLRSNQGAMTEGSFGMCPVN